MASATKQAAVVKPRAEKSLDWPVDLLHLPRRFGMKWSDVGMDGDHIRRTVELARNNKQPEAARCNALVNVMLELMARDSEERPCIDSRQRPVYIDSHGRETAARFSPTEYDDNGGLLEHPRKMEIRSRWGLRAGHETYQAPGLPAPTPGYWRDRVVDNWDNLLPQLAFLSDRFETGHMHHRDNVEACRAVHTAATSDEGPLRAELLAWLPEFLKRPESKWNGED